MFLKKVLNQPNLVGTMLIALMVCAGFVYAFAFDCFNVETTTQGEVEAWLAAAGGGGSGGAVCTCGNAHCSTEVYDAIKDKNVLKHGCKSDNACNGQTKTFPCKLNQGCRKKTGGASHNCVKKCGYSKPINNKPGYIDICKKSPKKPCNGKCK